MLLFDSQGALSVSEGTLLLPFVLSKQRSEERRRLETGLLLLMRYYQEHHWKALFIRIIFGWKREF